MDERTTKERNQREMVLRREPVLNERGGIGVYENQAKTMGNYVSKSATPSRDKHMMAKGSTPKYNKNKPNKPDSNRDVSPSFGNGKTPPNSDF